MVGASRWLEELSRSVAVGGIRGILRKALCAIQAKHERVLGTTSERQRVAAQRRYPFPPNRLPWAHLDGAAHPLLGNKREFLPKPDLFEGWVCFADAALAAHRSSQSGPGSPVQRDDAGLLQDFRQQAGLHGGLQGHR